jgi:hypothetical protein
VSRLHDLVADTMSNRLFRTMRVTKVSDLNHHPVRDISRWAPTVMLVTREETDDSPTNGP